MTEERQLLVLGLGNVLCGDDGLGIVALAMLRTEYEGEGVRMLDGGTLGLSLLPYLEEASDVVLVDAVGADAPAGSLVRVTGDEVGSAVAHRLSPHQVGVADLFDGARLTGKLPGRVILWGVVPARIELEVALSPPVRASLPGLVASVAEEIAELGYELHRRPDDERPDGDDHAHRVLGVLGG
jgi:hydrogenase maturation protease